jgi:hypothetical protein
VQLAAISQSDEGSITATASLRSRLLSILIGHDPSDSQADSAGSIPSPALIVKAQAREGVPRVVGDLTFLAVR